MSDDALYGMFTTMMSKADPRGISFISIFTNVEDSTELAVPFLYYTASHLHALHAQNRFNLTEGAVLHFVTNDRQFHASFRDFCYAASRKGSYPCRGVANDKSAFAVGEILVHFVEEPGDLIGMIVAGGYIDQKYDTENILYEATEKRIFSRFSTGVLGTCFVALLHLMEKKIIA